MKCNPSRVEYNSEPQKVMIGRRSRYAHLEGLTDKRKRRGIRWMPPCVTDTGCGIAAESLDKVFESLFTTKSKGIGLGLAVSKNLVEANRGIIKLERREHG